jgi:hypothetical protein
MENSSRLDKGFSIVSKDISRTMSRLCKGFVHPKSRSEFGYQQRNNTEVKQETTKMIEREELPLYAPAGNSVLLTGIPR